MESHKQSVFGAIAPARVVADTELWRSIGQRCAARLCVLLTHLDQLFRVGEADDPQSVDISIRPKIYFRNTDTPTIFMGFKASEVVLEDAT